MKVRKMFYSFCLMAILITSVATAGLADDGGGYLGGGTFTGSDGHTYGSGNTTLADDGQFGSGTGTRSEGGFIEVILEFFS